MTYYSKLAEKKISSKCIYRGVIGFNVDTVKLVNGQTSSREYTLHPGASAVLAFIDGKVLFVEQYRYPIKKITLEIPAGKRKKGQSYLTCAKAELEEETGFKARSIKKLVSYNPSGAFSDEILNIYFARGLYKGKRHLDDDEFVNVKLIDFDKALKMVKTGKITDSKTVIALLYYKALCL